MESLNDCPGAGSRNGRLYKAELEDPRSKMSLEISSPRPLVIYRLDDPCYGDHNAMKSDGVLVVEEGSGFPPTICFVELKGRGDDFDHAVSQIESAVKHFCPTPSREIHGTKHHERWKIGEDMPSYLKRRQKVTSLSLSKHHEVCGAVITNRAGTRIRRRKFKAMGRTIRVASVQKSNRSYGATKIEVDNLLSQIIKR